MQKYLNWFRKCWDRFKIKIISKKRWEAIHDELEEIRKKKDAALDDLNSSLELAEETEKKNTEMRKKLQALEEEVQEITLQLSTTKIKLENARKDREMTKKRKVLLLGGSPRRQETIDKIKNKWKHLDIDWLPSEKSKRSKGLITRIEKKVGLADLVLFVKDYIGHGKMNAALKVCRNNNGNSYKFLQTLSYRTLESALQQHL